MRILDCIAVAVYLVVVFSVGIANRGKQHTVDDYFTARGAFKGPLGTLIIGLSISASFISGLSLIAFNSSAYSDGIKVLGFLICPVIAFIFLRYWFLSRYLAANNRHPYDIVQQRFGYPVRACLSGMFMVLHTGWMALIIYAPTLIIIGALGLSHDWFWPLIFVIGMAGTILSTIGGVRGVIIVDAVQFIVILVSLLFVAITILARLHLPAAAIVDDLGAHGKLQLLDFSFSLTKPWTFWAIFVGQSICTMGQYMSDQMALQRYLAAESRGSVFRSFAINLLGSVAVTFLLVMVGLLLWVWYNQRPDAGLPKNTDQILPYFAVRELPAGMAGLLVAAFLAATMNTLTSGINSLAGAITNDFVGKLGPTRTSRMLLKWGRASSVGIGLLATVAAGFAGRLGTVLQASNIIMGAVLGPMFGCMALSASKLVLRPQAVLTGMILGVVASAAIGLSPISSFWVAPGGFLMTILVPGIDKLIWYRPPPQAPDLVPAAAGSTEMPG